jgi:hypothetical protein
VLSYAGITRLRNKPLATQREQEKALKALGSASADEVRITYFPDGSMLIRVNAHVSVDKGEGLPVASAKEQRSLLDNLPDNETEDSEDWIRRIRESRVDSDRVPFSEE